MIKVDDVKKYLGITHNDDVTDANIKRFIGVANTWAYGAIDNAPANDDRLDQLMLFVIEDLYDRGSYPVKENKTIEKLKNDFIMQLQCESRLDKQEAQGNGEL